MRVFNISFMIILCRFLADPMIVSIFVDIINAF